MPNSLLNTPNSPFSSPNSTLASPSSKQPTTKPLLTILGRLSRAVGVVLRDDSTRKRQLPTTVLVDTKPPEAPPPRLRRVSVSFRRYLYFLKQPAKPNKIENRDINEVNNTSKNEMVNSELWVDDNNESWRVITG